MLVGCYVYATSYALFVILRNKRNWLRLFTN